MIAGTVQTVEVLWVALLGAGALATVYCLADAIIDYREWLESGRNGDGIMVARAWVRTEAFRLVQQMILVGLGVWGMFRSPAPPHPVSLFERVFVLAFFAFGAFLTLNSVLGLIVRRRFMAARRSSHKGPDVPAEGG